MTIRIEIITVSDLNVDVALYYVIPDDIYSPVSEDRARQPAGNGLKGQELILFKEGHIYEMVVFADPLALTKDQFQESLEQLWFDNQNAAQISYSSKYSYTSIPDLEGEIWDGETWS